MKKPNILLVASYDVGGACKATIRLHLGLLEMGANSRLLTLHKSGNTIPEHYQFSNPKGLINSLKLKIKRRIDHTKKLSISKLDHLSGEFSLPISEYDLRLSEHFEWADIINLHWVNEFVDFESFFSTPASKPIFWTHHDMHAFTGGCHYSHGCDGFKLDCAACPILPGLEFRDMASGFLATKKSVLNSGNFNLTLISPSQWLANISSQSALFKDFNHKAIPNGLDISIYQPIEKEICRKVLHLPLQKTIILGVSQSLSDERKGFSLFIKALENFENKDHLCVVLVGKKQDTLAVNGLEIVHLGIISDERLMAIAYNAADVVVIPSSEDNLPNVAVEALSCGVPVAGFKIGGMPELVQQNVNGFLCETIEPKAFASEFNLFIKNILPKLNKHQISKEAHKKYSWLVQAKAYYDLFTQQIKA